MPSVQSVYEAQERRPWWDEPARPPTWKTALKKAGADWDVTVSPLFAEGGAGPAPEHFGLVADGTLLSVVGSRFHPVQNAEQFEFASKLGDICSGWVLRDGRVVGVTVQCKPKSAYLHVVNWHGGGALEVHPCVTEEATVLTTPGSVISIRHLKNLPRSSDIIKQVFAASGGSLSHLKDQLSKLGRMKATLAMFDKAYASVWAEPKGAPKGHATWRLRRDEIRWVYENLDNNTALGIYLAFCEWAQWGRPFRGTGGSVAKNDLMRAEEVLFGQTRMIGETVFKTLTKGEKR